MQKRGREIEKENYLDQQEQAHQLLESSLRHYPNKDNGWETYAYKPKVSK